MRIGVGLVPMRVIPVSRKMVCMESQTIILRWDDESLGYAVSPERMPLSALHQSLRISAEYNLAARQHRNAKLIEFVDYAPRFDEAEFERLTDLGRQAWKDVPDASAWVESLGGSAE